MTSNLGSEILHEYLEDKMGREREIGLEKARIELFALLRKTHRPEFLNRIDETILFTPLNSQEIKEIVRLQLKWVQKLLKKQEIVIDATEEAIEHIAHAGFDPQFGARPLKRVVQKELLNALSKDLLSGKIAADSVILVDTFENKLVFRNQVTPEINT